MSHAGPALKVIDVVLVGTQLAEAARALPPPLQNHHHLEQGDGGEDSRHPEGQGGNGGVEGRGPHHDVGPQLLPD